jgi:hypothetical protein
MIRTESEGSCVTAIRRLLVLWLAILSAAAPAAADTVITAREVISCSITSASADSIRIRLAPWRSRRLPAWDVYEVRLPDTARVTELAVLLPRVRVVLDSGQPVQPPEVRTCEAMKLRIDLAREARAKGFSASDGVVDTLPPATKSPEWMAVRCREMAVVLRECGGSDDAVVGLLRDVNGEQEALGRIWRRVSTNLVAGPCLGLLGWPIGYIVGLAIDPPDCYWDGGPRNCGGGPAGATVGLVAGSAIGVAVGTWQSIALFETHRRRVNGLIRRVNHAVLEAP